MFVASIVDDWLMLHNVQAFVAMPQQRRHSLLARRGNQHTEVSGSAVAIWETACN